MSGLPAPVAGKLVKLLPLLGSDKDGEVLGTVAAIRRTLKSAGRDLYDLARVLGPPEIEWADDPPEPPKPTYRWEPRWGSEPQACTTWCRLQPWERVVALDGIRMLRLSPWERDFVRSVDDELRRRPEGRFSRKQEAVLDRLMARAEARRSE